ncbi:MAG TPA: helix-turn-helix domain-containing protein [Lapillicoccus sp.]|nr:helix-turn-helix domain-containing protein [Lapillicoccus sp.]
MSGLDARSLAEALAPLLQRVGGVVVDDDTVRPDDVPVALTGGPVVHVRLAQPAEEVPAEAADLSDGLARLIADVERELGSPLAQLPRAGKQQAVRLLEERGAFEMRRSAETVAEALGVTRFTVYNYLNRRSTA